MIKLSILFILMIFSIQLVSEEVISNFQDSSSLFDMLIAILVLLTMIVVVLMLMVLKYYSCSKRFLSLLTRDSLSGLSNRKHIFDCLDSLFVSKSFERDRFSVLYLDIDDFKHINDTYGHGTGDNVIKHIADLSKMALRMTDVMGRIGGDEYFYIFPRTSPDEVERISLRLLKLIDSTPVFVSCDQIVNVSVSMGVCHYSETINTVSDIYDAADKALYKSKNNGKNRLSVA